jgi:drug/metabolite transporter (DMT)-like permease
MFVILCLTMSTLLGVIGQVFIKKGINAIGVLDFSSGLAMSYGRIFFNPFVILGLGLYFFGVFFWLYSLSKVDLSFAFPFVSLSYVLVVIMSWWFLGEHISAMRWAGVATICVGVLLISRT